VDSASNLLTNLLSGGSLGSMPIAEGAVSDLFSRPLFYSLYDWFLEVLYLSTKLPYIEIGWSWTLLNEVT
jgi:hypothetical protein